VEKGEKKKGLRGRSQAGWRIEWGVMGGDGHMRYGLSRAGDHEEKNYSMGTRQGKNLKKHLRTFRMGEKFAVDLLNIEFRT